MSTVGIVIHHHRDLAVKQARELIEWLTGNDHVVRLTELDSDTLGLNAEVVADDQFSKGLDLVVSLGGDGSILRAVELVGGSAVPVLGVNVGELGYLAMVEPGDEQHAIESFLAGEDEVVERMMVQATVHTSSGTTVHHALNDVVVERGATSTTIRLAVTIDDAYFHTYAADGLIVSTATGSTAYSLSARGPIVAPGLRALLLTPVAPHQLFDRSLVLKPSSTVTFEVAGHREARLSVDGRTLATLERGDTVVCTASPRTVRLVTFGDPSFHQVLKAKFGLADVRE
ncbi:MAG: NAD(+)/NADH kinase [Acidimicrobiales bacterium]